MKTGNQGACRSIKDTRPSIGACSLGHRFGRLWPWLLFLVACTSIPKKEFSAYKTAFSVMRMAGEAVVDDAFEVLSNATKESDQVLREQALAVYGDYVEALAALSDGKSEEDIGEAVDGLLGHVQALAAIVGYGAAVAPVATIAKEVLVMMQREHEARRFRGLVRGARPLIIAVEGLLLADIDGFCKARVAVIDDQVDKACEEFLPDDRQASALACMAVDPQGSVAAAELLAGRLRRFVEIRNAVDNKHPLSVVPVLTADTRLVLASLPLVEQMTTRAEATRSRVDALRAKKGAYEKLVRMYRTALADSTKTREQLERATASRDAVSLQTLIANSRGLLKAIADYQQKKEE